VIDRAFQHPLELEEKASMPLAGGIMQHGYQCGMVWGAALAAGAQSHRLHGPGPKAEAAAIHAAQKVVEAFRAQNGHVNCLEITDTDLKDTMQTIKFFIFKGGSVGCFRMAGRTAPVAFSAIDTALSEDLPEAPAPPVSCAALLARKMGASELHQTMAAGLAGGIGLCGGACGALGAAIWITGMRIREEGGGKLDYKDPRANAVIERFLKCTEYEFECSGIVGREFESAEDHAAHLRDGGCSEIIEALAAG
jgi:hypothetical protein